MLKKSLHYGVVFVVTLFVCASMSMANPTIDFTLSSANGGANTLISWEFGSDWLGTSGATGGAYVPAIGMLAPNLFANGFLSGNGTVTYSVENAGSIFDVTTNNTYQITSVSFMNSGGQQIVMFGFNNGASPLFVRDDQVRYIPGVDSYTIDPSFSSFALGTYTMSNNITTPATQETLTVVPEPSSLALLVVAGAGLAYMRRRKA